MDTPHRRLTAFGNQLIEVHLWLRREIDDLREDVEAQIAEAWFGTSMPTRDFPGMGARMRTLVALIASAMSFSSDVILCTLTPAAG